MKKQLQKSLKSLLALALMFSLVLGSVPAWAETVPKDTPTTEVTAEAETPSETATDATAEETEEVTSAEPTTPEAVTTPTTEVANQKVMQADGAAVDLTTLTVLAQDANGNIYGSKGVQFDADGKATEMVFFPLDLTAEEAANSPFLMSFRLKDGASFQIPNATLDGSGAFLGDLTAVQFKDHVAYYQTLVEQDKFNPLHVAGQTDAAWLMQLKRDWEVKVYPNDNDSNDKPNPIYLPNNTTIDGGGHRVYSQAENDHTLVRVASNQTLNLTNIIIDGSNTDGVPKYTGIDAGDGATLNINGHVTIENCQSYQWSRPNGDKGDGHSNKGGGGIYLHNNNTFTMTGENNIIRNCYSPSQGAGIYIGIDTSAGAVDYDGEIIIENAIFEGNNAVNRGGAICSQPDLTIKGGQFINNTASSYGGAVAANGNLTIEDGTIFSKNTSSQQGGAVKSGKNLTLQAVTFTENTSDKGGALYAFGNFNMNDVTFDGNEATSDGGAIYIDTENFEETGQPTLTNVKFTNNHAAQSGGAIFGEEYSLTTHNNTFSDNTADGQGGAVSFANRNEITWVDHNSTFTNNTAGEKGGAIWINGNLTLNDTILSHNNTDGNGGALYAESFGNASFILAMNRVNVSNNESHAVQDGGGGALFITEGFATTIKDTQFNDNKAVCHGGAISFVGDPTQAPEIVNSTFSHNIAGEDCLGGAIHTDSDMNITDSHFEENHAMQGGALYGGYGNIKILNSEFKENSAYLGGAIMSEGNMDLKNSRFIANRAAISPTEDATSAVGNGGAVMMAGELSIAGSLFKDNYAANTGGAIYNDLSEYADPVTDAAAYRYTTIDKQTEFIGNSAGDGYFAAPQNYADFTNLQFAKHEFSNDLFMPESIGKSLLNNYDINYKKSPVEVFYNANGGTFADDDATTVDLKGNKVKVDTDGHEIGVGLEDPTDIHLTILPKEKEPTRKGYTFIGWKADAMNNLYNADGSKADLKKTYQAGDTLDGKGSQVFIAQWKKKGGSSSTILPPLLNKVDHYQYISGYADHTFRPDQNITREEVAAMLSRLMNKPPVAGKVYPHDFSDMANNRWSITPVSYMSDQDLISGYPDGTFKPAKSITRAEFAAMVTRFDNLRAGDATFNDLSTDHWAYDAVASAATAGWISGYPDGSFKPNQPITRAEVISVTNRMLNRHADQDYIDENGAEITNFSDTKSGHWAYYAIVEASNGHEFIRVNNGKDETWQKITAKSFI